MPARRVNIGLVISGAATLGLGYAGAWTVMLLSSQDGPPLAWSMIPVVGPFLSAINTTNDGGASIGYLLAGLAQVTGLLMTIGGFTFGRSVVWREVLGDNGSISFIPAVTEGGAKLMAVGMF